MREYNLEKHRAEDKGPGMLEQRVEDWQEILDELNRLLPKISDLDACAGYALEDYIHDHVAAALETARDALNDFLMGETA